MTLASQLSASLPTLVGGLVDWLWERKLNEAVLKDVRCVQPRASPPHFPFTDRAVDLLAGELTSALAARVPAFVRCGSQGPADYYFLFPSGRGQRPEWIAIVVDAKHTQQQRGASVGGGGQEQLLRACARLTRAMMAAGHELVDARLVFVTNRDTLSPVPQTAAFEEALRVVQESIPHFSAEFVLLTGDSFNFPPFSDLLFVPSAMPTGH